MAHIQRGVYHWHSAGDRRRNQTLEVIPMKLCECGCGKSAPIAPRTRGALGWVKGQPVRYIFGHRHFSHRMSSTTEHNTYLAAKERCTNPKHKQWKDYGGRGIKFLFTSFKQFFIEVGFRPKDTVLDRRNNDKHYEVGNVRWVTPTISIRNQRVRIDNQSGTKGVHLHKGAWDVSVAIKGKKIHIGRFARKADAVQARQEAERKYYGA